MGIDVPQAMIVIVPIVGALTWLVRLEGRLQLSEARYMDLKSDLHEIKADVKIIRGRARGGQPNE